MHNSSLIYKQNNILSLLEKNDVMYLKNFLFSNLDKQMSELTISKNLQKFILSDRGTLFRGKKLKFLKKKELEPTFMEFKETHSAGTVKRLRSNKKRWSKLRTAVDRIKRNERRLRLGTKRSILRGITRQKSIQFTMSKEYRNGRFRPMAILKHLQSKLPTYLNRTNHNKKKYKKNNKHNIMLPHEHHVSRETRKLLKKLKNLKKAPRYDLPINPINSLPSKPNKTLKNITKSGGTSNYRGTKRLLFKRKNFSNNYMKLNTRSLKTKKINFIKKHTNTNKNDNLFTDTRQLISFGFKNNNKTVPDTSNLLSLNLFNFRSYNWGVIT